MMKHVRETEAIATSDWDGDGEVERGGGCVGRGFDGCEEGTR